MKNTEDIKKKVKYYVDLPYQVVVEKWDDGRGPYYVARLLECPDCMMTGDTPEEAIRELEEVKPEWFKTNLELGNKIPEPLMKKQYSGKVIIRMSPSLHESLIRMAELEGVSLNQYLVTTLSRALGRDEVIYVREKKASYRSK
jgi:predicted RNase H-like HicB family nuclease